MYKSIRQEIYVTFVKNPGWQKSRKFMDKSERNQMFITKIAALDILAEMNKCPTKPPVNIVVDYKDRMERFTDMAPSMESRILFSTMADTADKIMDLFN
mgnify:FL=1